VESRRTIIFLMILLLFLSSLPLLSFGKNSRANAQVTTTSSIEFGYGPTTLSPLDEGIPIYTFGDNLWVAVNSPEGLSVSLLRPDQSVAATTTLQSPAAVQLYTFGSSDQPGDWTVMITLGNVTNYLVGVILAVPDLSNASLSQYSLQQGNLNLGFALQQSNAYNIEGCLASSFAPNSTAFVPVPSALGGGSLRVESNGANISVYDSTRSHAQFTFWYELDYNYSFSGFVPNETITKTLAIARSPTFLFSKNSTNYGQLEIDAAPRPGRYVLSAFFDSSSGIAVTETRMLLDNNYTWLWLGGCNTFGVTSSNFTSQIGLSQRPSSWPRTLYFMYDSQGIEAVSTTALTINLARVDAATEPKNITLPNLNYTISENPRVVASETFGGSLYVIATSFPLSLIVTPSLGSMVLEQQNVNIPGSFTDTRFFIPVGTLQVHVSNNTKPFSGASVLVANSVGGELSSTTNSQGNDTIYLPAAAYNVTVFVRTANSSQNALISVGKVSDLYFAFSTPPSFTTAYLITALSAMALVGLTLNIWVWRARNRVRNQ
jgi:hypothetical protein